MAASATEKANSRDNPTADSPKCHQESLSQSREIIKPTVMELTKEVRTNILCTVEGCGKILPNTPALNMHLVKSHRIKDGIVNPTIRKNMKGSQKLYCCPIEGCPRGPNRPFSQFSLVKQLETKYKDDTNKTMTEREEPFRCVVKFASSNLLESIRQCASSGIASTPVTPLLSSIPIKGRNYFVIKDNGLGPS